MKIYTKTGDDGSTGLFGNERLPKHHVRIHAIGELDELNATIGLSISNSESLGVIRDQLVQSQNRLFDIGAEIACDPEGGFQMESVTQEDILALERAMDFMDSELPALANFILPGGSEFAARLHMARTVCRRAERVLLALNERTAIRREVKIYINRLSDYLFMSSRYANMKLSTADTVWTSEAGKNFPAS